MFHTSDFIAAAKVPRHLLPWKSEDHTRNARLHDGHAFLFDATSLAALHLVDDHGFNGYTIMDDSDWEIQRHMEAIRAATGRVLKTGLGFGCFVRACLQKPEVDHIDVVEIDRAIIDHFGAEFASNDRVTIHHADAFKFRLDGRQWDMAWHDIYCDGNDGLQSLHGELLIRYRDHVKRQGAWQFPRWAARLWTRCYGEHLVGSPRPSRTSCVE
ncbi:hypothetical protein [Roseibium sp. TrichSKD4]|uniref:hypothetical protein n=1 Tax=Roseibium sp. TrichSKD4 TaxID=744980 RepID=UPI00111269A3|nr:hypothetical protein [Roseibium sp. TrichSKD4]